MIQLNKIDNNYKINLIANNDKLGLNKYNAQYNLDIISGDEYGFRVQSSQEKSQSILTQNKYNDGIMVSTSNRDKELSFFNDTTKSTINVDETRMKIISPNLLLNTSSVIIGKGNINNNNIQNVVIYDDNIIKNTKVEIE